MNKFSDGFSDNSYEELLNEYAGESLGSKAAKQDDTRTAPAKKQSTPKPLRTQSPTAPQRERKTAPQKPVDKSPAKSTAPRTKSNADFSFDIKTIRTFDEEIKASQKSTEIFSNSNHTVKPEPVIEKRQANNRTARRAAPQKKTSPLSDKMAKFKSFNKKSVENASVNGEQVNSNEKFNAKNLAAKITMAFKQNTKAFIIFGCCILASVILSSIALSCINDVLAINRDDEQSIDVVLPNDADTDIAIETLHDAGLIKNEYFCKLFIKVKEKSEKEKPYLPGVYYFTESMGVEKMISRFKTSTVRGSRVSVTIPEGYTIDQIFDRLEKNEICSAAALYKTIDTIDFSSEYDFLKTIENPEQRYHTLEGYFFPATYEFEQGADPATVIREFLNAFQKRWTEDYAKQAEAISMTTDEVIRLASIIEKEGNSPEQFGLVSSVLHNRLNRSGVYPTLGCDSTKDYVKNTIGKREQSTTKLSAYYMIYNTYECEGLPAGAICNPGKDAIEAALKPETTQYYFFRHDKKGQIYMAQTKAQHDANGLKVEAENAKTN